MGIGQLEDYWDAHVELLRNQTLSTPVPREQTYEIIARMITRVIRLGRRKAVEGGHMFLLGLSLYIRGECAHYDDWAVVLPLKAALEQALADSSQHSRDLFLHGFLEHLFEDPRARAYFRDWQYVTLLKPLFREALDWGKHANSRGTDYLADPSLP
jgi:hypothetical protein